MKQEKIKVYDASVRIVDKLIKEGFVINDAPYYIIQNNIVDLMQKELRKILSSHKKAITNTLKEIDEIEHIRTIDNPNFEACAKEDNNWEIMKGQRCNPKCPAYELCYQGETIEEDKDIDDIKQEAKQIIKNNMR